MFLQVQIRERNKGVFHPRNSGVENMTITADYTNAITSKMLSWRFTELLIVCVNVCACRCARATPTEVGQLTAVHSLLLPYEFQGQNSGHWTGQKAQQANKQPNHHWSTSLAPQLEIFAVVEHSKVNRRQQRGEGVLVRACYWRVRPLKATSLHVWTPGTEPTILHSVHPIQCLLAFFNHENAKT